MYFNSQPHKEADIHQLHKTKQENYFNSQPHKEADKEITEYEYDRDISIHSLTRRLTPRIIITVNNQKDFNSQPHKEADFMSFLV